MAPVPTTAAISISKTKNTGENIRKGSDVGIVISMGIMRISVTRIAPIGKCPRTMGPILRKISVMMLVLVIFLRNKRVRMLAELSDATNVVALTCGHNAPY